jgi:hypothetical protein
MIGKENASPRLLAVATAMVDGTMALASTAKRPEMAGGGPIEGSRAKEVRAAGGANEPTMAAIGAAKEDMTATRVLGPSVV